MLRAAILHECQNYLEGGGGLGGSEKNRGKVSQVTTAKSLGVTIDDRLDWSGYIEKVTKKVASGIGAIKRIRHLVPQATLQLIYQALIQPHFDYCNIVWENCGITLHTGRNNRINLF